MKNRTVPIAFLVLALGCGGAATTGSGETGGAGAGMSQGAVGGVPIGGFGGALANGGGSAASAGEKGIAGSSGANGEAGAPAATCGELTALDACFDTFCQANGAGTPFCACFTRGYDLSEPPDCECISLDSAAFCQQAEASGLDGSHFDCNAATAAVALQCVAAQ